jgi:hypothetical protein
MLFRVKFFRSTSCDLLNRKNLIDLTLLWRLNGYYTKMYNVGHIPFWLSIREGLFYMVGIRNDRVFNMVLNFKKYPILISNFYAFPCLNVRNLMSYSRNRATKGMPLFMTGHRNWKCIYQ